MQTVKQETITITEVVTLGMAIETFLNVEMMGLSWKTKRWYEFRLLKLSRYLGKNRNIVAILEVDLLNYCEKLDKSKLAPDTKHGYIRSMKKFFKFLHRRDILPVDVAKDLKLPKLPARARALPKFWTDIKRGWKSKSLFRPINGVIVGAGNGFKTGCLCRKCRNLQGIRQSR